MTPDTLRSLHERFAAYAHSFAPPNGPLPPMMRLKLDHSLRVSQECRAVAAELAWSPVEQCLAEAAGLLHDVGRFEQVRRFGTFADTRSADHGDLGLSVLDQTQFLAALDPKTTAAIRAAVGCHNKRDVPADVPPELRPLVHLVRDVDKLDIMSLIEHSIRSAEYAREPGVLLHVSAEGPITPELLAEVRGGATGSYGNVRSLADIRLVGVSWTRDITYLPVLQRLQARGLTTGLAEALAPYPEACALAQRLLYQMRDRLAAWDRRPDTTPSPGGLPSLPRS